MRLLLQNLDRSHVNVFVKLVVVIGGLIALSAIGHALAMRPEFGISIIFLLSLALVLASSRETFFVIMIFLMLNLFGFIDQQSFLRIPGLFKFRDVVLVSVFLIGLLGMVEKGQLRIAHTPSAKILYIWLSVIGFVFVHTVLKQDFNLTLRVARDYAYLGLFFILPFFLGTEQRIRRVLQIFLVIAVATSLFLIIQAVSPSLKILPPYIYQYIYTSSFKRVYSTVIPFNFFAGLMLFSYALRKPVLRSWFWPSFGIIMIASLMTLARSLWAGILLGGITILVLRDKRRLKFSRVAKHVLGTAISMLMIVWIIKQVTGVDFLQVFQNRLYTGIIQFETGQGTFFERLEWLIERLEYAYRSGNIWLGFGFVHYAGGVVTEFGTEQQQNLLVMENGHGTMLMTTGVLGYVVYLLSMALFVRRFRQIAHLIDNPVFGSFITASYAFIIGKQIEMFFSGGFASFDVLLQFAVIAGVVEVIWHLAQRRNLKSEFQQ